MIGTIFASKNDLERFDAHSNRLNAKRDKMTVQGTEKRVIGGETRHYLNENTYAVFNVDLKLKWFSIRVDGDYAISDPREKMKENGK